jgi:tripartite-type tricarboxylate transporter receptor subunit TctC
MPTAATEIAGRSGSSPAEFAAFIKQDLAKYEKLVKTAGIRID